MKYKIHNIFIIPTILIGICACSPIIANRGQIIDDEKLSSIEVGFSTRKDVAMIIGSPTQTSTFNENKWYYFGRSTKQTSFFDPKVIEQKAVVIIFDDEGVVSSIEKEDPKLAKAITPVDRRTPTYGHQTTIIEQIVGNLGRPTSRGGK